MLLFEGVTTPKIDEGGRPFARQADKLFRPQTRTSTDEGDRPVGRQADDLHGPPGPRPIVVVRGSQMLKAMNTRQILATGRETSSDYGMSRLLDFNNRHCNERTSTGQVLCTGVPSATTCPGRSRRIYSSDFLLIPQMFLFQPIRVVSTRRLTRWAANWLQASGRITSIFMWSHSLWSSIDVNTCMLDKGPAFFEIDRRL